MPLSARLISFAPAPESLIVEDIPASAPGAGEVLIDMLAAPVNPADINVIEGKYGDLPKLPATIGNEGVGRIAAVGPGVPHLAPGRIVLPMAFGNWCQKMTVSSERVVALPDDVDIHQAAMLSVNPATAWRILHDFADLKPGDWVVQNAANSGVGRSLIQLARALGYRTLNVVRRPELVDELLAAGADRVVTEECELRKEVRTLCDGAKPRLGLNSVGGASALNVAGALAPGSPLVTFGAMSRQALKIPNGLLIFSDIRFVGFWLKRWKDQSDATTIRETYDALAVHLKNGTLKTPVHGVYPLARVVDAVEAAGRDQRSGKILLDLAA